MHTIIYELCLYIYNIYYKLILNEAFSEISTPIIISSEIIIQLKTLIKQNIKEISTYNIEESNAYDFEMILK